MSLYPQNRANARLLTAEYSDNWAYRKAGTRIRRGPRSGGNCSALRGFLHEKSGEGLAVIKRDDPPQNRNDDRNTHTHVEQQQVIQEDVDDDRAKNREPERNVAIHEQKRAACDL